MRAIKAVFVYTPSPPLWLCVFSRHPNLSSICSVGHKGRFGHEFMEFEVQPDGRFRYANNSNYKNDVMIRKEGEFCLFVLLVVMC
jgi:hypothetical protein